MRLPFRHTGNRLKASEAASNSAMSPAGSRPAEPASSTKPQFHAPSFAKVLGRRKQPICGLWERNGRFYAQLKTEDSLTGEKKTPRIPLVDRKGPLVPCKRRLGYLESGSLIRRSLGFRSILLRVTEPRPDTSVPVQKGPSLRGTLLCRPSEPELRAGASS